ncbi:hypothetical protein Sm713_75790 [Streptomyces sp. TS71-3]|nr:hypothetical protein Sm713_75790 [Streptomyces sp. TS71-3]
MPVHIAGYRSRPIALRTDRKVASEAAVNLPARARAMPPGKPGAHRAVAQSERRSAARSPQSAVPSPPNVFYVMDMINPGD